MNGVDQNNLFFIYFIIYVGIKDSIFVFVHDDV